MRTSRVLNDLQHPVFFGGGHTGRFYSGGGGGGDLPPDQSVHVRPRCSSLSMSIDEQRVFPCPTSSSGSRGGFLRRGQKPVAHRKSDVPLMYARSLPEEVGAA